MPIPAYDSNLKKPIWLSFMIYFMILDFPDNVFNCLSCFWFICPITMLSFFRSEPNFYSKFTHVYCLTLQPIKQVEHFLFYGLFVAFLLELLCVFVFDKVDYLFVFVDVLSGPLVQVLDDTFELHPDGVQVVFIVLVRQMVEIGVQLMVDFLV